MSDWRDDEWDDLMARTRGGEGSGDDTNEDVRPFWKRDLDATGDADAWAAEVRDEPSSWDAGDATGAAPLPHWTEPPTSEVPRVGDTGDDWSALTGSTPRFRTDSGDWASGDFEEGELEHDESTLVGALDEAPPEEPFAAPMTRRERRQQREAATGRRGRRGAPEVAPAVAEPPSPEAEIWGDDGYVEEPISGTVAAVGAAGSLEGAPREPRGGRPFGGGEGPAGGDANRRIITAAIIGAVAILCLVVGQVTTLLLAMAIVGVCAFEFYEVLRRAGYHTATLVGLVGAIAFVPVAYDQGTAAFPMMFFIVTAFTMLWYLFEVMRARPTVNVALTLLVFAYVGGFGAFAGLLLAPDHGVGYVLGVVLCVIAYDVVGWFVGRNLGRTPLMPRISPNKTVEGLAGGMIAALIMGVIVVSVVGGWKQGGFADGLLLGLVMAIVAPLGDLVESMFKRDLGIKDFGTLLPGHGGVLDRFDALLFALPAAYFVALHIVT